MNRNIKVYTEVQSMYDMRRGLMQWLMTEGIVNDDNLRVREGDRLWSLHINRTYAERRMDLFEYPTFGVTKAKVDALLAEAKLEHWLMYYPTALCWSMFRKIIELEHLDEKPLDIKGVTLYINTFPYAFDDAMETAFLDHCNTLFGGRFEIKLQNIDTRSAEPFFYQQYNYVFKYDIMDEPYKAFQTKLMQQPIPKTTFVIPDILSREVEAFAGPVADRIFAYSLTVAQVVKLVPISHAFYDYAPPKP
jgi:hypothetical protein